MRKEIHDLINAVNARKSTGPKTPAGKQRSSMNACKHNLTGQSLILQDDEMEAYNRLTSALLSDFKPMTELERQIVQKIIDAHFRLNRIAGVENNIFNFSLLERTTDTPHDDRIEAMIAQTRAWIDRSNSFDVLGRYETRIARQVLHYTLELERLQKDRAKRERHDSTRQTNETKENSFELASFGRTEPALAMAANSWQVLTQFPPREPGPTTEKPVTPA